MFLPVHFCNLLFQSIPCILLTQIKASVSPTLCRNTCVVATGKPLYFRGLRIRNAILATLVRDYGLGNARDVLLTGCSSGGQYKQPPPPTHIHTRTQTYTHTSTQDTPKDTETDEQGAERRGSSMSILIIRNQSYTCTHNNTRIEVFTMYTFPYIHAYTPIHLNIHRPTADAHTYISLHTCT